MHQLNIRNKAQLTSTQARRATAVEGSQRSTFIVALLLGFGLSSWRCDYTIGVWSLLLGVWSLLLRVWSMLLGAWSLLLGRGHCCYGCGHCSFGCDHCCWGCDIVLRKGVDRLREFDLQLSYGVWPGYCTVTGQIGLLRIENIMYKWTQTVSLVNKSQQHLLVEATVRKVYYNMEMWS